MRVARLITAFMLVTTGVQPAHAGLAEADKAFDSGMYTNAYREYRSLAESGNADAQYRLGEMYNSGK